MDEKKLKHLTFEELFRPLDILMATTGIHKLYQPGNRTKFQIFQWILCIISVSNLALLVMGTAMFGVTTESTLYVLQVIPNVVFSTISLLKLATLIMRRKLIYELIKDLKSLWPRAEDLNAIKRFHKIVSPTSKICLFYLAMTTGTTFGFGMTPIFRAILDYMQFGKVHMKMAYLIWYPFDYEKSSPLFVFIFVSQFWSGITATSLMATSDILFCLLISLLCYHFEAISDNLKAVHPITSDSCGDNRSEGDINDSLKECILYHCHLLRLCKLLEDIFSFVMFVNLSLSSLLICETLFNLMMIPPDKRSTYVLYIASVTFEVFLICWQADKLISQSSKLTSAAYHSGWYKADKYFKMNLIQLQLGTQRPVELTAMKFVTLSIKTFLNIVASAWSYFTLLRQLYGK